MDSVPSAPRSEKEYRSPSPEWPAWRRKLRARTFGRITRRGTPLLSTIARNELPARRTLGVISNRPSVTASVRASIVMSGKSGGMQCKW